MGAMYFLKVACGALVLVQTAVSFQFPTEGRIPFALEIQNQVHPPATTEDITTASSLYKPHNFSTPIDHFPTSNKYTPHTTAHFTIRFWLDAQYYKPGGPIIACLGGETSGENRLPFLQKGIISKLANATGGVGLVLEHRYYGASLPVSNLTTESLRFLDTQQAMADVAYMARSIIFPGLEKYDLTASNAPWIVYGGSYAGAEAAFLRKVYPDVFWGAISSSGVTKAIEDYAEYWEPIRANGDAACIEATQNIIGLVDGILIDRNYTELTGFLQRTMGFGGLKDPVDFTSLLAAIGPERWQSRNWDPKVNYPGWDRYCKIITSEKLLYPETERLIPALSLLVAASHRIPDATPQFYRQAQNLIGYLNATFAAPCAAANQTQEQCFGTRNPNFYTRTDLSQEWRLWGYQVCTQWGYFQTGSGIPSKHLPIISRTIDLAYMSRYCDLAFNLSRSDLNVTEINQYGAFDVGMDRLAFIDGQADPWVGATPHAPEARGRKDSVERPFVLIEGAVHHWDENGLFPGEVREHLPPKSIRDVQAYEEVFVKAWMEEWTTKKKVEGMSLEL